MVKSGYIITLTANAGASAMGSSTVCGNNVSQPVDDYWADASPLGKGQTGYRNFATDTHGTIWQDTTIAPGGHIAKPILGTASTVPVQ